MAIVNAENWHKHFDSEEPQFTYLGKCWFEGKEGEQWFRDHQTKGRIGTFSSQLREHRKKKAATVNRKWVTKRMGDYIHDDQYRIRATDAQVQTRSDLIEQRILSQPQSAVAYDKPPHYDMSRCVPDAEVKIRASLAALVTYVLYVSLLIFIIIGLHYPSSYFLTSALRKLLVKTKFENNNGIMLDFTEIKNPLDIPKYLRTHFKDSMFLKSQYIGDPDVRPHTEDTKNILYENRMIGLCRLRMVRVQDQSCYVNDVFVDYFDSCSDYYSSTSEFRSEFMGGKRSWKWKEGVGTTFVGKFGVYPPNGYFEDIDAENLNSFDDIYENRWISKSIRALTVHFTVYNANLNYFSVVLLAFEMPPTGGVYTSHTLRTVRLINYENNWDYFILGLQMSLIVFTIYYAIQEIREFKFFSWYYFTFVWKYIDIMICAGLFFLITLALYLEIYLTFVLKQSSNEYINFESIAEIKIVYNHILVVIVFVSWFKIFFFFDFTHVLKKFKFALVKCAADMIWFTILVTFFFSAFAHMGTLLFGMGLEEYSTVFDTYMTLIRVVAGDVDFDTLTAFDGVCGPIYLMSFVIVVLNIVLNVSVSVLNEAYLDMKAQGLVHDTNLTTYKFLSRFVYNIFHGGKKSINFSKYKERIKISCSDIVQLLLEHSFTPMEIHAFFAKYKMKQYRTSHTLSSDHLAKIIKNITYLELECFVPIDFFLDSAKQLKKRLEIEEKDIYSGLVMKKDDDLDDYENVSMRLDGLEMKLDLICDRLIYLRQFFIQESRYVVE